MERELFDEVIELSCNLDDMSPEDIGFAMERLLEAGALDVWTIPIGMKKNRPGTQLCLLCKMDAEKDFASLLFRHTTTLGIRRTTHTRYLLRRDFVRTATPWGPVRMKRAGQQCKPEYEDLRAIALREGLPIAQVRQAAIENYKKEWDSHDRTL